MTLTHLYLNAGSQQRPRMDGVGWGTITYPMASCGLTNNRADGLILISSREPNIWELRKMTSNPQELSRSIMTICILERLRTQERLSLWRQRPQQCKPCAESPAIFLGVQSTLGGWRIWSLVLAEAGMVASAVLLRSTMGSNHWMV